MCGIYCCIDHDHQGVESSTLAKEFDPFRDLVEARGPDFTAERMERIDDKTLGHFVGSVLWTQGSEMTPQPVVDPSTGNILLWNGDIYSSILTWNELKSDTANLSDALSASNDVICTLRKVKGPYSFIYLDRTRNSLYFGRDPIGRRSLLMKFDTRKILLSSVAPKIVENVVEVPAIGIFKLDLNQEDQKLVCYLSEPVNDYASKVISDFEATLGIVISVININGEIQKMQSNPEVNEDMNHLIAATLIHGFSGKMEYLLNSSMFDSKVHHLLGLLNDSVKVRVQKQPKLCRMCSKLVIEDRMAPCNHPKVGILFSGGLDSAILAATADKFIPRNEAIDLLNVAFEVPGKSFDVPDRQTGFRTLEELKSISPEREWNFVEINVTQKELSLHRSTRIRNLIHPKVTILDESLGCAVWFASRGRGSLRNEDYTSPSRVLLIGMGADEMFGGYMRHRNTLKRNGWQALTEELNHDSDRISERNLGRDDRVLSDHGRQARMPYLDEACIEYVRGLKPWEKCYPVEEMSAGTGDKLLLRLLAYKIGLRSAANLPKRAFQFGSRIANGKENAKDISTRL